MYRKQVGIAREVNIVRTNLNERGKNITFLQGTLLKMMDGEDTTRVVNSALDLVREMPPVDGTGSNRQGLMLGLIQSGKTAALTTSIALAADNQYKLFVVLTTDNNWLYAQTLQRLETDLQGIRVIGKNFEQEEMFIPLSLESTDSGLVFVLTKNSKVLSKFDALLVRLASRLNIPVALVVDDEADQASLDTQNNRRSRDPQIEKGRINDLITKIRNRFSHHTFLQVTATPQALFLQDSNEYRPEFTIILEPGKGYVGGNTFFSIIENEEEAEEEGRISSSLIRYIEQSDLDEILSSPPNRKPDHSNIPSSLRVSLATFFVGATIKYLGNQGTKVATDLVYSYLCHISERKADHDRAYVFVSAYYRFLVESLGTTALQENKQLALADLRQAYDELQSTIGADNCSSFDEVVSEFADYITSTNIQILNSDKEQDQPNYTRRYNLLIGGTKLARGVTIKNLLVTYYGRQSRTTNMDTMLQHARMYGYRQADLDATRLFVTSVVENRFRLITESEAALRRVVKTFPNQEYQTIFIGRGVNATRRTVLNPDNVGAYAAGSSYFPKRPIVDDLERMRITTEDIDQIINGLYPDNGTKDAVLISIDEIIRIIKIPLFDTSAGGLWDTERMSKALATLKDMYRNTGYLVVRRDRNLGPSRSRANNELGSVLAGGSSGGEGLIRFGRRDSLTLYMLKNKARKWLAPAPAEELHFWIPVVQFPEGRFALTFNFDE